MKSSELLVSHALYTLRLHFITLKHVYILRTNVVYVLNGPVNIVFQQFPSKKYHFQASLLSKQEVFQIEIGNPKIVQIFLKRTSNTKYCFFPSLYERISSKAKSSSIRYFPFPLEFNPYFGDYFQTCAFFQSLRYYTQCCQLLRKLEI